MFAKPMEKLNVACSWHCEIDYHHEDHSSSLSFKNKIAELKRAQLELYWSIISLLNLQIKN